MTFTIARLVPNLQAPDDFAHVLFALTRANKQSVVGIDDDQIAHADGGDEFLPNVSVLRVSIRMLGPIERLPSASHSSV